jgi:chitin binding peritrophin-A domain
MNDTRSVTGHQKHHPATNVSFIVILNVFLKVFVYYKLDQTPGQRRPDQGYDQERRPLAGPQQAPPQRPQRPKIPPQGQEGYDHKQLEECRQDKLKADSKDCRRYYKCVRTKDGHEERLFECPYGKVFHQRRQICVPQEDEQCGFDLEGKS